MGHPLLYEGPYSTEMDGAKTTSIDIRSARYRVLRHDLDDRMIPNIFFLSSFYQGIFFLPIKNTTLLSDH